MYNKLTTMVLNFQTVVQMTIYCTQSLSVLFNMFIFVKQSSIKSNKSNKTCTLLVKLLKSAAVCVCVVVLGLMRALRNDFQPPTPSVVEFNWLARAACLMPGGDILHKGRACLWSVDPVNSVLISSCHYR